MSKSIMLEISEAEAANLESALDQLLNALRRLDEEHQARWEEIDRLKTETHLMMRQIAGRTECGRNFMTSCRDCLVLPKRSTGTTRR